jgi:hypothetical protein
MTAGWDFDYRPVRNAAVDEGEPAKDLVIATKGDVDPARIVELLAPGGADVEVTPLIATHPLFWTRVQAQKALDRRRLVDVLARAGIGVRYVTSARRGSQLLAPPLDFSEARPRRASDWRARPKRAHAELDTPGRWFLGSEGVDVERTVCGTGAGTRIAIVDNDGGAVEELALDAELRVGIDQPSRTSYHAAQLVAWAVGGRSGTFTGVAPDASPRLYVIPKPGVDVFTLPLAIARAVDDGADVVVCATHIEGQNGPLLDDALELAARLGRRARGSVVIFPTSRELSSPPGSVHASLTLGLGEPASDPRVLCVAPSGRDGSWFLWRDKTGKLRPFSNRGPAVRFMAPGDDLADPIASAFAQQNSERMTHAESSGASAIAAGVALLVLARNPDLSASELTEVLECSVVSELRSRSETQVGDQNDLLPTGRDADGHDAKHGYGRLAARRACLVARDPVAAACIAIGADQTAASWLTRLGNAETERPAYSPELGAWAARALLADPELRHRAKLLARHLRLLAGHQDREVAQLPGALIRMVTLCVRALRSSRRAPEPPQCVARELGELGEQLNAIATDPAGAHAWEAAVYDRAAGLCAPMGESELKSQSRARIAS